MSYLIHYNHNHDNLGRFAKSGLSKVAKYDKKAQKAFIKSGKYELKSIKYQRKANKKAARAAKRGSYWDPTTRRDVSRNSAKSYNYSQKAAKYRQKQTKYINKAKAWADRINETVGDTPMSDIQNTKFGKKRVNAVRKYCVGVVG